MQAKRFPQANVTFKSSDKNFQAEIPAWRGKDVNGKDCTVTYWEISPVELNEMLRTNRVGVYLTTEGHNAPMIGIQSLSPFGPEKPQSKIITLNGHSKKG